MATYLQCSSTLALPMNSNSSLPPAPPTLSKMVFVNESSVIHATGNTLRVFQPFQGVSSSPDDFIFSETGRGVSSFAYSLKLKRLAFSSRRLNPEIVVREYPPANAADPPEASHALTITDGTELEYVDLAFSRDGTMLAGEEAIRWRLRGEGCPQRVE